MFRPVVVSFATVVIVLFLLGAATGPTARSPHEPGGVDFTSAGAPGNAQSVERFVSYEYKIVPHPFFNPNVTPQNASDELLRLLNSNGKQGWRFIPVPNSKEILFERSRWLIRPSTVPEKREKPVSEPERGAASERTSKD